MQPTALPNGHLLVPARAEGPNGEIGEGMREIGPDDPAYQLWLNWLWYQHPDAAREASDEPQGG
jgi:hypothetical protein